MCQGDCNGVFTNVVGSLFPKSASLEAYIQPSTGHILTTAVSHRTQIPFDVLTVSSSMLRGDFRSSLTTYTRMGFDHRIDRGLSHNKVLFRAVHDGEALFIC